jgi:hypothetical protein
MLVAATPLVGAWALVVGPVLLIAGTIGLFTVEYRVQRMTGAGHGTARRNARKLMFRVLGGFLRS